MIIACGQIVYQCAGYLRVGLTIGVDIGGEAAYYRHFGFNWWV